MHEAQGSHAAKIVDCVRRNGAATAETEIPPVVVQSWNRCLYEYGLDPNRPTIECVLDDASLRIRQESMGEFLEIARAEMKNLYQQTAGSGYAVLLADATGTIIERVADPSLEEAFAAGGLWAGADWSERYAGTNGMGTCLHERQPITIHRDEHFLSCNIRLSCSASPILGPHGELLGVLDASSVCCRDTRESQLHTVALVNMSARLIENCNFLRVYRDAWVLRFHVRPEFVGLLTEGMLAVDADGLVTATNQSAVTQLGLGSRREAVANPVEELFDLPAKLLVGRGEGSGYPVWPVRDRRYGKRYFATLRQPLSGGRVSTSAAGGRRRMVRPLQPGRRGGFYTLRALMSGDDPRMAYNVRCAGRLMDKNVSILLYGETGTGKDALARAIHAASSRAEKPFVAVNCASIPESLIESELFGYRPGAFTGARRDGLRGRLAQSSGGTLFLDEIGDMPAELQTRLLRVLEEQEILPLGSETPTPVDLHVISATHRDLPALVADGSFREDLYYRLNGVALTLPTLRERRDRETVIRSVLGEECEDGHEVGIDAEAFERMMRFPWPGNIRQLRNCIRTTLALCDDGVIRLADLPPELIRASGTLSPQAIGPASETVAQRSNEHDDEQADEVSAGSPLACAERQTLLAVLERHRWNITSTAQFLGVSRNTIYRKMKKHGIEFSSGRAADD